MSNKQIKIDPELIVTREVLHLPHLHLGVWSIGAHPTVEDLPAAQKEFTRLVISKLDTDKEKNNPVLDVGCGAGAGTKVLLENGYNAEGLSPDPYHEEIFKKELPGVPFHPTTFEEFSTEKKFGAIIFSESSQYIRSLYFLFKKCRGLLKPGGSRRVIIADYFTKAGKEYLGGDNTPIQSEEQLLAAAEKNGFVLSDVDDITERTLPTMKLIADFHNKYFAPSVNVLDKIVANRSPKLYFVLKMLFRRKINKLKKHLTTDMVRRFDPEAYVDKGWYKIYTFNIK